MVRLQVPRVVSAGCEEFWSVSRPGLVKCSNGHVITASGDTLEGGMERGPGVEVIIHAA